MYAAAGGASLAGRKARQHGRQPAPQSPHPHSPPHPAPTGVRAFSCQHWESRLSAPPPRPLSALVSEPHSPCDLVECTAGRTAWQEAAALSVGGGGAGAGGAARRCSVLGDHPGARRDPRKWHRNNRVRDASYGSSSESDGEAEGAAGEPWGVARLLYAGLGILALGLVVYFVGTGDKGFKTPALRLVGPSLIITGLACCLLRIMFCIFAKPCCRRRTNYKESRRLSGCGEGEEMPLARGGGGPRVGPAQCSPARRLESSSCDVSSLSSGEEDERLRRYRTTPAPNHLHIPSMPAQQALQSAQQNTEGVQAQARPQALRQSSSQPSAPRQNASTSAVRQSSSQPTAIQPSASQTSTVLPNASQTSTVLPNASQTNAVLPNASQTSAVLPNASQTSAVLPSASQTSALQTVLPSGSQQSALQPNGSQQSAFHQPGSRRPPPRNVSFAGGPDGELVLSPAQLRS
ncbi:unnamed protein product [Chilo suppressalis]|uniref:Uncharacterized protein n=1 Tax=Chilo suppressalis TaxID=168631 RepID=A0ABN8E9N0_CHISP|nr:unnamed protein product [Chilo suppressalis]